MYSMDIKNYFSSKTNRYLSCDKYGILFASSSAISPFETFNAIQSPSDHGHTGSGLFSFQTRGGDTETETFLTIKSSKTGGTSNKKAGSGGIVELRGDASAISFDTTVRVRMQARFKPRLRASKESKARGKISRRELEAAVGRRLQDDEVKRLKKARREGNFHEEVLNVRVRGKHDKFASF
jgi:protein FRG1